MRRAPPAGGCDRDVLGYTHVLSSPGYPYGYPPNQYCLYRVWRADSSVCLLELDVRDFELNQRDCFRDYLDLPDGRQFCGQVSGTSESAIPSAMMQCARLHARSVYVLHLTRGLDSPFLHILRQGGSVGQRNVGRRSWRGACGNS